MIIYIIGIICVFASLLKSASRHNYSTYNRADRLNMLATFVSLLLYLDISLLTSILGFGLWSNRYTLSLYAAAASGVTKSLYNERIEMFEKSWRWSISSKFLSLMLYLCGKIDNVMILLRLRKIFITILLISLRNYYYFDFVECHVVLLILFVTEAFITSQEFIYHVIFDDVKHNKTYLICIMNKRKFEALQTEAVKYESKLYDAVILANMNFGVRTSFAT